MKPLMKDWTALPYRMKVIAGHTSGPKADSLQRRHMNRLLVSCHATQSLKVCGRLLAKTTKIFSCGYS
jgi:hypothetical protein